MDETTTEWIGLLFVFIGIFGFAFLHLNTLGHVISGLNIDTPFQEKIEFPQIEPLIMKANEQKIITFDIQNNGKETLTDCIFSVKNEKNEISDWIKAPQKTDIPPSQKKSFEFYITTPHDAQPKTYYKKIKLICDKKTYTKEFTIDIIKELETLKIKSIKQTNQGIIITYLFNNKNFSKSDVNTQLWLTTPEGNEIAKIVDIFKTQDKELIEREVIIKTSPNTVGIHTIYLAFAHDKTNHIQKSIILGRSPATGQAIFNIAKGKGLGYFTFLAFIGIGIFFIFKNHRKALQENEEEMQDEDY